MADFDKFDHHDFGLIQVSKGKYLPCRDVCCKTGGPAFTDLLEVPHNEDWS